MRNSKGQFVKGEKPETFLNVSLQCQLCDKVFTSSANGSKWCRECRVVNLACLICKKPFNMLRMDFNKRGAKYCSRDCCLKETSIASSSPEQHWNWKGGVCLPENRKEYQKQHRLNNQAQYAFYAERRRMSKLTNGGTHSFEQWEELKRKYNYMCLCCKQQAPFITLSEDHIVPVSCGGSDDISNIQPLCRSCNSRKHVKTINYIELYGVQL